MMVDLCYAIVLCSDLVRVDEVCKEIWNYPMVRDISAWITDT